MRLDHINIRAPYELMLALKDFYREFLELEAGSRPASGSRGFWLYAGDVPVIHLSESEQHSPPVETGHFDHVAFRVDDLETVISRLERRSIPYTTATVAGLGMRQIFFRDPAGVKVEVNWLQRS